MHHIVVAIVLGLSGALPAAAQAPADVDVKAFVARGQTLLVMREALDQLLRI